MPTVEFTIKVPLKIKKKDKIFVSYCPALDVCSQGNTAEEARTNLIEAVKLFIVTCFERGTLDAVFKQCGFKPKKTISTLPQDHRFISVPIPFSVAGSCAAACHV
jgi:predicted RNase H-like HicB family nuclease